MTSNNSSWETPPWLFKTLDEIFHFNLDCAASPENALCSKFLTYDNRYFYMTEFDALSVDWLNLAKQGNNSNPTAWLNPPYTRELLPAFIRKVEQEYDKGLTIVTLLASRTETNWFNICWERARYLVFLNQRLKFELRKKPVGTATFPSVLAIFSPYKWNLWQLNSIGHVIEQNVIANKELLTLP